MYLSQQIESTIHAIKKSPMDLNLRLSLVQLYLLQANWQQALKTSKRLFKAIPMMSKVRYYYLRILIVKFSGNECLTMNFLYKVI